MDILQDINSLHEKLQSEVQETFADVLASVARDPAKNTGTCYLKLTIFTGLARHELELGSSIELTFNLCSVSFTLSSGEQLVQHKTCDAGLN